MPETPPWANGMEMLTRGVYCEPDGRLHLDLSEMCCAAGVPPTRENCETMARMAREMFEELGTTVEEWKEDTTQNERHSN